MATVFWEAVELFQMIMPALSVHCTLMQLKWRGNRAFIRFVLWIRESYQWVSKDGTAPRSKHCESKIMHKYGNLMFELSSVKSFDFDSLLCWSKFQFLMRGPHNIKPVLLTWVGHPQFHATSWIISELIALLRQQKFAFFIEFVYLKIYDFEFHIKALEELISKITFKSLCIWMTWDASILELWWRVLFRSKRTHKSTFSNYTTIIISRYYMGFIILTPCVGEIVRQRKIKSLLQNVLSVFYWGGYIFVFKFCLGGFLSVWNEQYLDLRFLNIYATNLF